MKTWIFFAIFYVWCATALSAGENEIKRGQYPYMGFLYYSDETVLDSSGSRFLRAAVLIRAEWLLSATIDMHLGFPHKTLLARMGAVTIDPKFTLNEDEYEQEREVIQVARPNVLEPDSWWVTDISLLKTLLPFKISFAVAPIAINAKRDYNGKTCIILFYNKRAQASSINTTGERGLMQLYVDMLPPTSENCGRQFNATTMACATENDNTKNAVYDPEFCQGNSGGPLICENEVMGLQTYIDGNCKPPHLYQLLSSWEAFLNCGVNERCNLDYECSICAVTNKDETSSNDLTASAALQKLPPAASSDANITISNPGTTDQTTDDKTIRDGKTGDDKNNAWYNITDKVNFTGVPSDDNNQETAMDASDRRSSKDTANAILASALQKPTYPTKPTSQTDSALGSDQKVSVYTYAQKNYVNSPNTTANAKDGAMKRTTTQYVNRYANASLVYMKTQATKAQANNTSGRRVPAVAAQGLAGKKQRSEATHITQVWAINILMMSSAMILMF